MAGRYQAVRGEQTGDEWPGDSKQPGGCGITRMVTSSQEGDVQPGGCGVTTMAPNSQEGEVQPGRQRALSNAPSCQGGGGAEIGKKRGA